jgi:radical SAM protein with 4Fe4S-binding SPASM domain
MKINLTEEEIEKLKNNKGVKPYRVKFQITNACNAKCKHCNLYLIKPELLSRDVVLKTLFDLSQLGCSDVDFTGGEPTTHPDFIEFIKVAKNYGFNVKANTNGFLLTDKFSEQLIKSGLKELAISIDSYNPKEHDKRRRLKGSWQKAINGINFIDKYRRKYKTNTKIILYSILSKDSYKNAPNVLDLKKIANFDEINFIPIKDIENKEDFLSKKQIEDFYKNVRPILLEKYDQYKLTGIFRTINDPFEILSSQEKTNSINAKYTEDIYKNIPCYITNFYSYIISDGSVVQCCVAPHHLKPEFIMGNINQQNFKNIWNSDKYNQLRKTLLRPTFEICKCCSGHHTAFNININQQLIDNEKR